MGARRFPEMFCGFARRRAAPTLPGLCAAGVGECGVFALGQASLGIVFDHDAQQLRSTSVLPPFIARLHVRGMSSMAPVSMCSCSAGAARLRRR